MRMEDAMKPPQFMQINGSALARVKAVSPGFRASLVQPLATLRPFRCAARVGDPPRLDSCYPAPRRLGGWNEEARGFGIMMRSTVKSETGAKSMKSNPELGICNVCK